MIVYVGRNLLGAGVFGHSLGTLADGVLGQLSGEEQTNGSLDFPTGDGAALVVVGQTRGFGSNALENVVDKAVHDRHGLAANTRVGVHLLQHLVNVDAVGFLPPLLLLFLISLSDVLLGLARFFRCLAGSLRRHFVTIVLYTSTGQCVWGASTFLLFI